MGQVKGHGSRVFLFSEDILVCLENVSGRKHPSSLQAKQLKASLPLMKIVQHLIPSSVCYDL